MENNKDVVLFIIVFFVVLGYGWFWVRPVSRKFAYKEAVEKQYFEYENKLYKVELYDELKIPETIEDKE